MSSLSTTAVAAAAPLQVEECSPAVETPGVPVNNDVDDSSTLDEVDVTHLLVMKKSVSHCSTCSVLFVPFGDLILVLPPIEQLNIPLSTILNPNCFT